MSDLTREALVAEAEKVNAERTPGPWIAENMESREDGSPGCAWGVEAGGTSERMGKIVVMHDFVGPNDAAFIAFAGTHMGTLLSLLHTDAAKVQELEKEISESWWKLGHSYRDYYSSLPEALESVAKSLKEAREHANVADYNTGFEAGRKHGETVAELTRKAVAGLEADRDRLAAEVAEYKGAWEVIRADRDDLLVRHGASLRYIEQAAAEVKRLTARWEALKEWAGKPDTSVDVGAHGIPEVKRIIRDLEAQR